jgi:hypothetical protein
VLHEVVEANRAAAEYQKCQLRLPGYEPIEEHELTGIFKFPCAIEAPH